MKISTLPPSLTPKPLPRPTVEAPRPEPTPQDEITWSEFKKNPNFMPATLVNLSPEGKWHLSGVRWGFDEVGASSRDWKPRFKDITVDPKDIKEVYIAVEPFAPEWIAGHGEAVLEFHTPMTNADGEQDNRLVISLEAWTRPDDSYGLLKGMKKNFGVIYQLGTFSDRVQRQCRKEGRPIVLHRLNLTQEQKEQFVQVSLKEAVEGRTGEFYNTLTNSCFAAQVANLNQVLPENKQIHRWTNWLGLPKLSATIPGTAGLVLERYHLRTPDSPIEILPDARLHPEAASLKPRGWAAQITQKDWWGTACRLTGASTGVALGASLAGTPAALLGGLVGSYIAGVAGDHARILNSSERVRPDAFYPAHVQASLNNPPSV
jgi:hypothetical protein